MGLPKTKVLFVGRSLKVGGITRALVGQVNALDKSKYQVDLLLFSKSGAYLDDVNKDVNIIGDYPLLRKISLTQDDARQKGPITYLIRGLFAFMAKAIGSPRLYRFLFKFIKSIGTYDCAISYVHDGTIRGLYYGCNLFVLTKVRAKCKVAWIHSDYVGAHLNNPISDALYRQFDKVVNVSNAMKMKYDQLGLTKEVDSLVVYNRFNEKEIIEKSLAFDVKEMSQSGFNLVTVGRLEQWKGVDQLLRVAAEMHKKGLIFHWFFVGTGVLNSWSKTFILENGMQDKVFLVGQQKNPYPFIKKADLFVSGSLSETFGLSVLEALILKTPVVAYRYDSIDELLTESNGVVCDDFDQLKDKVTELVEDKVIYAELQKKTALLSDYNALSEKQFLALIEV